MTPNTPVKELYNLWRYIQHLILESKYDYDGDEYDNPLNENNWLLQTRGKLMKFCYISFIKCYKTKKLFQTKDGKL